jgi:energy-coupling factor transporter transmembrane protein EcfT
VSGCNPAVVVADVVDVVAVSAGWGPILWNRFVRNLRTKTYLVCFKFVTMTFKSQIIVHIAHLDLYMLLCTPGGNLTTIWGGKYIHPKIFRPKRSFVKSVPGPMS